MDKIPALLKEIYETFLDLMFYPNDPVELLDNYAIEDVMGYGTALDEKIMDIKGLKDIAILQRDQAPDLKLKLELHPVYRKMMNGDKTGIIVDEIKISMLVDDKEVILNLRLSSIWQMIKGNWKIVHWHSSKPEYDSGGTDTWHKEEWTQKQALLERQVQEKTEELQKQNRELEIESALERVRAIAMSMQKPDDLADVCQTISEQLEALNVKNIRNVQLAIINEEQRNYANYQYFAAYSKQVFEEPMYGENPSADAMVRAMQESANSFFIGSIQGEEFWDFIEWRKKDDQFPDPLLEKAGVVYYYFYSIGKGGLGLTTYAEISNESLEVFKRFHKVFTLAYQRYKDIRQALEQAREAQIEAALERVRSLALGMRKSEEVGNVTDKLFEELNRITGKIFGCTIAVVDEEKDRMELWRARTKVAVKPFETVSFLELMRIFKKNMPDWFPVFYKALTAKEKGLLTEDISGKGRTQTLNSIAEQYNYSKEEKLKLIKNTPENFTTHFLFFNLGYLALLTREKYSDEGLNVVRRFVDLFGFAYTRFLDLQKAEAQTREAQIETALEKVRSRSMGMQKSDELNEVIHVIYDQFDLLGVKVDHTGFIIDYKNRDDMLIWLADKNGPLTKIAIPYFDSPHWNSFVEAKKKGLNFFANQLNFETKNKFYKALFKFIPELPDESKKFYLECPGLAISTVLLDNVGLYIENFSGTPYSAEENKILMRFGKVFQQSYTRFIDLEKAEAQARVARIEAALERVRSRSMGMQKSEELADLSLELVRQVKALGVETWFCAFNIYDDHPDGSMEWGSNGQGTFPKYRTPREGVFLRYYKAGQKGEKLLINEIGENECPAHYEYLCSLPGVGEQLLKMKDAGIPFPTSQIDHVAYFKFGYIIFITFEPAPEAHEIFIRFAHVFEQTYTRFLDLQKAEQQAREAQIEASLEKVRGVALSLQKSDEMLQVAQVLYEQLLELGFANIRNAIIDIKNGDTDTFTDYDYSHEMSGTITQMSYHDDPTLTGQFQKMANTTNNFFELILEGSELDDLKKMRIKNGEAPDPRLENIDVLTYNLYSFGNGAIGISNFGVLSEDEKTVLNRFSNVFTFAYKRYTDLAAAEAQAREVQIELSLERIRAQVTAMQESAELLDIVVSMRSEFVSLGHEAHYFWYMRYLEKTYEKAMTSGDGTRIGMVMTLPRHIHGDIQRVAEWEKHGEAALVFAMETETAVDYVDKMISLGDFEQVDPKAPTLDDIRALGGLTFVMARTLYGEIGFSLPGYIPEPPIESLEVLDRFANVFDLAYRRFEDLKSAERQNRETQIELALERVRSQVTAMQESTDLFDIVVNMRNEFVALGHDADYFWHMQWQQDAYKMWMTSDDGNRIGMVITIPKHVHQNLPHLAEWEKGTDPTFVLPLDADGAWDYIDNMNKHGHYELADPNAPTREDIQHIGGLTFVMARTTHGEIGFGLPGYVADPPQESLDTLTRFAGVFDLAYRRFEDLKSAEARTKETLKQATLDRVRGQVASMRKPEDLQQITPLIWKELKTLNVPFFRCGIFIVNEKMKHIQVYLTTPEGKSLAVLNLDFNQSDLTRGTILSWKKNEVYHTHWNKAEFTAWTRTMMKLHQIDTPEQYQGAEQPPDTLHLHFIPFAQGMLYVGHTEPLAKEKINLVKSLAEAFSFAYARYEDFVVLEEAKMRIEKALIDLKSTQAQLIHAEKMASLGELTAGIAHEIQNPLNFVNNFSEVSADLVKELKEELQKGETLEVEAIASDLLLNLEKINHHGQRASNIVKSMLEHSRTGSGEKHPTDLNALADEYLRLAYHGLRAKTKSFNADFKLEADKNLPQISVVSQDIGRVLLNLIHNAFFAVNEKAETKKEGYQPLVRVITKLLENNVEIKIVDNGNGIPNSIKEKIFQPFFTTKPTGQGTGLGLSMSYDIITKGHGGQLIVNSAVDEGSEFIIRLPII